jgi:hypothetical protein
MHAALVAEIVNELFGQNKMIILEETYSAPKEANQFGF